MHCDTFYSATLARKPPEGAGGMVAMMEAPPLADRAASPGEVVARDDTAAPE